MSKRACVMGLALLSVWLTPASPTRGEEGARAPKQRLHWECGHVLCVAISPDGKSLATGEFGGLAKVWDAATGKEVATLEPGFGAVYGLAFTPDAKTLVIGGDAEAVRLFDIASRRERAALEGHRFSVRSLAIAPDGKTLATISATLAVHVWDLSPPPK